MLVGERGNSLRQRYTPALKDARVLSEGPIEIALQRIRALRRNQGSTYWGIMETNRWFGARTAARLERAGLLAAGPNGKPPAVFAYSYAAREILETARRAGCITVLGQIDAGPVEDDLVAEVARRHGFDDYERKRPPPQYWENWRSECALADVVLVNSQWSAAAIARGGVDASRIRVAPLSYDVDAEAHQLSVHRSYPKHFSDTRPLRLLFLGQVTLRKGAFELLEAMQRLEGSPVQLTMVGPVQDGLRERFRASSQVDWIDTVTHSETAAYYRAADVFILPTHSDGFALTQLEAQTYGLPVFASRHCGEVVDDGVNGRVIDPVAASSIATLLGWALDNSYALEAMSDQAFRQAQRFTAARAVDALIGAVAEL